MSSRIAIVIMCYNRPDYLRMVLTSLQESLRYFTEQWPDIYLFQDGSYNPLSHTNKCPDDLIDQSVAVFREIMPSGIVMRSPINLGVALNYFRAEEYVLGAARYTSAMFFEDDMILHKYYVSVLYRLLLQAEQEIRIGHVSCYGNNHLLAVETQIEARNALAAMGHSWGFGTTSAFYKKRRRLDKQYVDQISTVDYQEKDRLTKTIQEIHAALGFKPNVLSQDMLKAMTTLSLGGVRYNTRAVLGFYVGEVGLHSNPEKYAKLQFDKTVRYPDDAPMPEPTISLGANYHDELCRQATMAGKISAAA